LSRIFAIVVDRETMAGPEGIIAWGQFQSAVLVYEEAILCPEPLKLLGLISVVIVGKVMVAVPFGVVHLEGISSVFALGATKMVLKQMALSVELLPGMNVEKRMAGYLLRSGLWLDVLPAALVKGETTPCSGYLNLSCGLPSAVAV
jgi:hypothetical protein